MKEMKTLNLRVDADLKREAETIFSDLGLPTSTAITIFLKSVVRYGGIPFDLRLSEAERETLAAIDDVNHHRNLSKTYNSVAEVMKALNA